MHLPHLLLLLLLLSTALLTLAASPVSNLDLTIYAWPISYNPHTLNATLKSWTPPTDPLDSSTLLRIGLHDPQAPAEASWTGVATSASSLQPTYRKKLTLFTDSEGRGRREGPRPVLNRPVVLNKEGKVEEAKEEKTFLQKYWWAIGLFILVQVLAGGGGKE
ncbi:hypothetical protein H2199_000241 [Coniosporium tulheliwenetii]|uniref:Uncharacterized protein n=1 Tax=Coniosporium tulheliwenetii TaxID=3383036 RepID=A0ACC2ZPE9_9PEZI|nr:hypothetical protein H2199_000241 [Cladosporium sp. JES 115]